MKSIGELKLEFEELLKMEDSDDGVFEFKESLLESDERDRLEFHFSLLPEIDDEDLYRDVLYFFTCRRDKSGVADFLHEKYENESDATLKSDILRTLGLLKAPIARELSLREITSPNRESRYNSIIVLGWTGKKKDLPVLNERMQNDPDGQLRSYSATAMRQIWYEHPKSRDAIAAYIRAAAPQEKDAEALTGMIITIQTLTRKKFGIKEGDYGDISGDVEQAKEKMIAFLNRKVSGIRCQESDQ
ncbi:MAG: HEAT repeat domain-containing protein [Candidatus Accumulibacter sp.]|jgi:HEAT repeat protein|nr:HEAT repeat domain-containing protein [Accumulibacter sp.]